MAITTLCFDLDNVLVNTADMHHESLNMAIREVAGTKYVITPEDRHIYEALPTKSKLNLLARYNGLPHKFFKDIYNLKQEKTALAIPNVVKSSQRLINIFATLKRDEVNIVCVSNAIRATVETALYHLGVSPFFDYIVSNEDVIMEKPHPCGYLAAMARFGASPHETLCFEDSPKGLRAVALSGARLCEIRNPDDLTLDRIKMYMDIYS